MAGGTGLLALLDDITTLLDDIATLTKVAASKTAGVVGDDLAVGAEQVSSISANREMPVVKKVAIGSLINKGILIPMTLGISALSLWTGVSLIAPLLVIGGGYLCYEGYEKTAHWLKHRNKEDKKEHAAMLDAAAKDNLQEFEKKKIKGAINTDFVLSAEIMILTLGTVAAAPFIAQVGTLIATGIGMTVFVYGLVAGIVKIDNQGGWLMKREGDSLAVKCLRGFGHGLLKAAPILMKTLTVAGTGAMFVVGGGILMHNIPLLTGLAHHITGFVATAVEGVVGVVVGLATVHAAKPVGRAVNACKTVIKKIFTRAIPAEKATPAFEAPTPESKLAEKNTLDKNFTQQAKAVKDKAQVEMPLVNGFPPMPF